MYSQLKDDDSLEEAFDMLDVRFLNFYRKDILLYLENKEITENLFNHLANSVAIINPEALKDMSLIIRQEFKAILQGNRNKFNRLTGYHHFFRDFKRGRKSKRNLYYFLHNHIFSVLPKKKKQIFIES